jgi:multidrug efflux pump subunit AcrB
MIGAQGLKRRRVVCGARPSPATDRVEVFCGPMAHAIIGGLFVATLLTLLFPLALYVAWFRIE